MNSLLSIAEKEDFDPPDVFSPDANEARHAAAVV